MELVREPNAPEGIGAYSPALRAGEFVFVSGQGPLDPRTLKVYGETVAAQTHRTLDNVCALVAAAGGSTSDIVRMNVFLASSADYEEFDAAYRDFFQHEPLPTRTTVGCDLGGILIEIDCIAHVPEARRGRC